MSYLVFVDIETTGLDPKKDDIIQIAALGTEAKPPFLVKGKFECKIFPTEEAEKRLFASAFAKKTNYNKTQWLEEAFPAEKAGTALSNFTAWLRPFACIEKISRKNTTYKIAPSAGWNVKFDLDFLMSFYKRHDRFLPLSLRGFDAMQAFMYYELLKNGSFGENYKLEASYLRLFGKELDAHDAMADIIGTLEIFQEISEFLEVRTLITKEE